MTLKTSSAMLLQFKHIREVNLWNNQAPVCLYILGGPGHQILSIKLRAVNNQWRRPSSSVWTLKLAAAVSLYYPTNSFSWTSLSWKEYRREYKAQGQGHSLSCQGCFKPYATLSVIFTQNNTKWFHRKSSSFGICYWSCVAIGNIFQRYSVKIV